MIGIGVGGSEGRMGISVLSAAAIDNEMECVLQINRQIDLADVIKKPKLNRKSLS